MQNDKTINKNYNLKYIDKLKEKLLQIGFTDDQFNEHINKLGNLIFISTFRRLTELKPPSKILENKDELLSYIQSNFPSRKIDLILRQESKRIIGEYIESLKEQKPEKNF